METVFYASEPILVHRRKGIYVGAGERVGTIKMIHPNVSVSTLVSSRQFEPTGSDPITYVARRRIKYGPEGGERFIQEGEKIAEVTLHQELIDRSTFFGLVTNGKAVQKRTEEVEEEELII